MGRRKRKKELKKLGLPATRRQHRKADKQVWKELKKSPMPVTKRQHRKYDKKTSRDFEKSLIPLAVELGNRFKEERETGTFRPLTDQEVFDLMKEDKEKQQ